MKWYWQSPTDLFFDDRHGCPFGLVWAGDRYICALVLWRGDSLCHHVDSIEEGQRWVEAQEQFAALEMIA